MAKNEAFIELTCRCGKTNVVKIASVRRLKRLGRSYRCLSCASADNNPPKPVGQRAVDQRINVTCQCGKISTVSYSKWHGKYRNGRVPYRCTSCASKDAYAADPTLVNRIASKTTVIHKAKDQRVNVTCACGVETTVMHDYFMRHLRATNKPYQCCACATRETGLSLRHTPEDFIATALQRHGGKYAYTGDYTRAVDPITAVCSDHGPFRVQASNHISAYGQGCPVCSGQVTRPMLEIGAFLTELGVTFEYNNRSIIAPKEIDIWLPDRNLGVEYHGLRWHGYSVLGAHYHQDKWELATQAGAKLVQIFEDEWRDKRELVQQMLRYRVGCVPVKIAARKCQVISLTGPESSAFMSANHIQGRDNAPIRYALTLKGVNMAVMTFAKPSLAGGDKKVEWMISRFACLGGHSVAGGFSRLLKHFIGERQPASIGTYADLRWGNGDVYVKNGFVHSHITAPNYFYFNPQSPVAVRKHRFSYRKSRLRAQMGAGFNEAETEWQNAQRFGLDRVYDAGNSYFTWTGCPSDPAPHGDNTSS